MYALDYIAAWEHFVLIGSQANGIVMSVLWSLSVVRGLEKKLRPQLMRTHCQFRTMDWEDSPSSLCISNPCPLHL